MDIRGVNLPNPKSMNYKIPKELNNIKNYSNLETYIPPMKMFFDTENKYIIF